MLKRVLVVLVLAGLFAVSIAEISSADGDAGAPCLSGAEGACLIEPQDAPATGRALSLCDPCAID